jgi:hypothetical protein
LAEKNLAEKKLGQKKIWAEKILAHILATTPTGPHHHTCSAPLPPALPLLKNYTKIAEMKE